MDIKPGYNPQEKKVVISVTTNLLERYMSNLKGLVEEDSEVPEGTKVEAGRTINEALITFPIPKDAKTEENEASGIGTITMNPKTMDNMNGIINYFVNAALHKELRTIEFIPLEGYSFDNLSDEIMSAVKNKRRLCVIKSYEEYLNMGVSKRDFRFHQYVVMPGTEEYTELALMIFNKEEEKIREIYEPKLTLEEWV